MDQTEQPQGKFVINLNFRRNANKDAPPITGRISTPEDPETAFAFSAFRHDSDKGPYWIGSVEMNRSIRQALNTQPTRGEHFVAIRENGFKVFSELFDKDGNPHSNPAYIALSPDQQKAEDAKPAYWATWTRTPELPQLRAAAWERDPSRYGPWASGNTQHPMTKEQAAAIQAGQPDATVLNAPEPAQPVRGARAKVAAGRDRV